MKNGVDVDKHKTVFDRREARTMLTALSFSAEGVGVIEALEEVRFFHNDARVIDLGHGGVLVTAVEQAWYGHNDVASVLIPGRRDVLERGTADCSSRPVPAALFWPRLAQVPVTVPLVLGLWAVECAVSCRYNNRVPARRCAPVSCTVDGIPWAAVTAPSGDYYHDYLRSLPGLTVDKWAHRRARRVVRREYAMPPVPFDEGMRGYSLAAPLYYGVAAGCVVMAMEDTEPGSSWALPQRELGDDAFSQNPDGEAWMRAACQWATGASHWEYFDRCPRQQLARHLLTRDWRPVDLPPIVNADGE